MPTLIEAEAAIALTCFSNDNLESIMTPKIFNSETISTTEPSINKSGNKGNVGKTAVIIFGKNKSLTSRNVNLFLISQTSDLNDSLDIDRCNRSFGFLFRKFNSVNVEFFLFLFESYCNSFYGAELWLDRKKCLKSFDQCRKILGIHKFYGNLFTCDALNVFTVENLN